jgi:hypothetical protein
MPVRSEQHVLRLEVAVHVARRVDVLQRDQNLRRVQAGCGLRSPESQERSVSQQPSRIYDTSRAEAKRTTGTVFIFTRSLNSSPPSRCSISKYR